MLHLHYLWVLVALCIALLPLVQIRVLVRLQLLIHILAWRPSYYLTIDSFVMDVWFNARRWLLNANGIKSRGEISLNVWLGQHAIDWAHFHRHRLVWVMVLLLLIVLSHGTSSTIKENIVKVNIVLVLRARYHKTRLHTVILSRSTAFELLLRPHEILCLLECSMRLLAHYSYAFLGLIAFLLFSGLLLTSIRLYGHVVCVSIYWIMTRCIQARLY